MYTCGKMPTHFTQGCLGDDKKILTKMNENVFECYFNFQDYTVQVLILLDMQFKKQKQRK